jgi:hypothetical protein
LKNGAPLSTPFCDGRRTGVLPPKLGIAQSAINDSAKTILAVDFMRYSSEFEEQGFSPPQV